MGALGGGKHSLFFTLLVKKCVWAAVMQLFVFPRVHMADLWLFKPRAALKQDSAEIRNGLNISYIFFSYREALVFIRRGRDKTHFKGKKSLKV